MEEINLRENLDEAYSRALLGTTLGPEGLHERELLHVKRSMLVDLFDTLRVLGGQSTTSS